MWATTTTLVKEGAGSFDILMQAEHRLLRSGIQKIQKEVGKVGRRMLAGEATKTEAGCTSVGVALLVRQHIQVNSFSRSTGAQEIATKEDQEEVGHRAHQTSKGILARLGSRGTSVLKKQNTWHPAVEVANSIVAGCTSHFHGQAPPSGPHSANFGGRQGTTIRESVDDIMTRRSGSAGAVVAQVIGDINTQVEKLRNKECTISPKSTIIEIPAAKEEQQLFLFGNSNQSQQEESCKMSATEGSGGSYGQDPALRRCGWGRVRLAAAGRPPTEIGQGCFGALWGEEQTEARVELMAILQFISQHPEGDPQIHIDHLDHGRYASRLKEVLPEAHQDLWEEVRQQVRCRSVDVIEVAAHLDRNPGMVLAYDSAAVGGNFVADRLAEVGAASGQVLPHQAQQVTETRTMA